MRKLFNRRESLERAYETLERANRTLDQQKRDLVAGDEPMPIANWRGCSSTQAMTASQFDQWCRDGKPALGARDVSPAPHLPAVTKSKVDAVVRVAIDQERAKWQASLEAAVAIIGEECGKADAKLTEQIRQLRIELAELRAELHEVRGERSAGVIDLPDWRSHAAH